MNDLKELVRENYKRISYEIGEASYKYGSEEPVQFMAVTKTVPPELINEAISCGINLLGENRVQEFCEKREAYLPEASVHFIGNLQTNKVKYIIDHVSMIQSVNSARLADEINRLASKRGIVKDILIEVNIGKEESKGGIFPEELQNLVYHVSECENLRLKGLMSIPPKTDEEKYFSAMKELYIDISSKKIDNINMSVLSMGMSSDFTTAIKYGSNLVRIGSRLFGTRK